MSYNQLKFQDNKRSNQKLNHNLYNKKNNILGFDLWKTMQKNWEPLFPVPGVQGGDQWRVITLKDLNYTEVTTERIKWMSPPNLLHAARPITTDSQLISYAQI